jgi:hypothetical protein
MRLFENVEGIRTMTYLVMFWGLGSCRFEGPFADEQTAVEWLGDYEPDATDGFDYAMVVGPLPCSHQREF